MMLLFTPPLTKCKSKKVRSVVNTADLKSDTTTLLKQEDTNPLVMHPIILCYLNSNSYQ
jgi:hypothetical protein